MPNSTSSDGDETPEIPPDNETATPPTLDRWYKQSVTAPFTNDPIPIDEIPQLTDDAFVPVDPRYLRASLAGTAIMAIVVIAAGSVIAWQTEEAIAGAAITGGILLFISLSVVMRVLEVRRLAYQIRQHDISMRSGVIHHRVESLPFARVQHVRVNRSAVERGLGLATVQISSAGPNITIPGLAEAEAARIKLLVTQRAGMEIEEDTSSTTPAAIPPHAPVAAPLAAAPVTPLVPTSPPVLPAQPLSSARPPTGPPIQPMPPSTPTAPPEPPAPIPE